MPKELTHWMLALAASAKIDEHATPQAARALQACPQAFLLGAVAHDGPFYLPEQPAMASLGAKLHGAGVDDAYAPIKRILAAKPTASAVAVAAGALAHLAADTVFHPAIFYFTGFASHPGVSVNRAYLFRHRSFEAALDLHLLAERGVGRGEGFDRKLKALAARATARPEAKDLWEALARFYAEGGRLPSEDTARTIVHQAGKTQRLFFSAPLRLLARLLSVRKAGTNSDLSGLFYGRTRQWDTLFTSPRPYRDPISGTEGVFELRELFGRAVDRTLSLWGALERAVEGDTDAFPLPGPSLDSGHPVSEDQVMKYCDPALEQRST